MTTKEPISSKYYPNTTEYDQYNVPAYQQTYQPQASNPYHAGYDQPTDSSMHPYPAQQQTIQVQPPDTAINRHQQPDVDVKNDRRPNEFRLAFLVCCFCTWITGIPAVKYAIMAEEMYSLGRWEDAKYYQKMARRYIIASIVIGVAAYTFGAVYIVVHVSTSQ